MGSMRRPYDYRRGNARTLGLIAASGLAVAFGLVVAWYAMRPTTLPPEPVAVTLAPPVPEVRALAGDVGSGAAKVNRIGSGSGFFFTFVDKADPSRAVGELTAKRSEPLENKRYRLDEPRAWLLSKQGRWVRVEAARGRAYLPDDAPNARPQQAVLEGDVVVRVYAPRADGARPGESDTPILVGRTPVLEYDGTLGQVLMPQRVEIDSGQIVFRGSGVTLLVNDAEQRLEAMTIEKTERLVIDPKAPALFADSAGPAAPAHAQMPAPAPVAMPRSALLGLLQATPAPAAPERAAGASVTPVESLYQLTAKENVVIERDGRRVTADVVEGWARLVDNRLRPDAIADNRDLGGSGRAAKAATPASTPASAPAVSPAAGGDKGPASEKVEMAWSGRAEVRLMARATPELQRDDVFVRFRSERECGVVVSDPKGQPQVAANLVEYAATTRRAAVGGAGGKPARLFAPNGAMAGGRRFDVDLASGIAVSEGEGVLFGGVGGGGGEGRRAAAACEPLPSVESLRGERRGAQALSWSNRAEFRFATDGGQMTSRLVSAEVVGAARAINSEAELRGDTMTAAFVSREGAGTEAGNGAGEESWIRRLDVGGHVSADDGKGGTLRSDRLAVDFADAAPTGGPTGGEAGGAAGGERRQPDPVAMLATGAVEAGRGGAVLGSERLEVTLEPRGAGVTTARDGESAVTRVIATDKVWFRNADGVNARADRLDADPRGRVVLLTGERPEVGKDATLVTAGSAGTIRLNDAERSIAVEGAGTFAHADPANADRGVRRVVAVWSDGMTYADGVGEAVCKGRASVEIDTAALAAADARGARGPERDVVRGDEVRVAVEGNAAAPSPASVGAEIPPERRERRFVRAEAAGGAAAGGTAAVGGEPARPATVELRRYAASDPSVLEQLLFLEGERVVADNEAGTIRVPSPGRLVTLDRRAADGAGAMGARSTSMSDAASPLGGGSMRGSSLFTWKGTMTVDRAAGTATLTGGSRMVHDSIASGGTPTGDATRTELECADLVARFRETTGDAPAADAAGPRGELVSVRATASVWLRSGQRELVSDVLDYDASKRTADAQALSDTPVTLLDRGTGVPLSAKRLLWDLGSNRIEVLQPVTPLLPR